MSKGLEALKNIKSEAGTPYFSTLYDIDMWREDFAIVENELKALEIIRKYISINRAFKNLANKESVNLTLIEIKALIPDEEYNLLKEIL